MTAIVVRDLTRRFGEFTAVDRVSFDVEQGEIFGFLGPNGAGKTTTIKMLTGLLAPSGGTMQIAGYDASQVHRFKRRIGYMSQMFSLYSDLTVEENIRLFGGLYGVSGPQFVRRRDWVLEMAGLEQQRATLTLELPLGWKQRLALGCAVLHEPEILFLDEPTSGVDPLSRRSFWDLIDALAAAGTTILVSTHYMEEAEYCHRLALMHRGRLIALARPADIRAMMDTPLYSLTTDDPAKAVTALRSLPGVLDAAMFGRLIHVTARDAASAEREIRGGLERAGRTCEALAQVDPSLEDVFVELVRREGTEAR